MALRGRGRRRKLDWSQLPWELLCSISQLLTITDYIRFRAVCSSWRSATTSRPRHLPCPSPWLALPCQQEIEEEDDDDEEEAGVVNGPTCSFFSLADDKRYNIVPPEALGKKYLGSCDGWLVVRENDHKIPISLLNPLTRAQIKLPPFPLSKRAAMPVTFMKKVVVSSPCHALAALGWTKQVSFCKPGDEAWTIVSGTAVYHDAIFWNGRFHVVDNFRRVFACDIGLCGRLTEVPCVGIPMAPDLLDSERCYLVESYGDLLLVIRHFDCDFLQFASQRLVTKKFRVFKLSFIGHTKWIEVSNLGDRMLFLGLNSSMSLSATDHPGWKGNHIYFTDDLINCDGDIVNLNDDYGAFNLEDDSIEPLPCYLGNSTSPSPPAIWFTPTLC